MSAIRQWTWVIVWLAATLLFADSARAKEPKPRRPECHELVEAIVNTTLRRSGGVGSECFATYLTAEGHLGLDVTVRDPAAAEARIDFFGQVCEATGTDGDEYRYPEMLAASIVVEIREAGRVAFCVAAQDPRLRLGEYKLRVAFAEGSIPEPRVSA